MEAATKHLASCPEFEGSASYPNSMRIFRSPDAVVVGFEEVEAGWVAPAYPNPFEEDDGTGSAIVVIVYKICTECRDGKYPQKMIQSSCSCVPRSGMTGIV
jgi:hypothetical protein